jgi:hypothetical protein
MYLERIDKVKVSTYDDYQKVILVSIEENLIGGWLIIVELWNKNLFNDK